VEQYIRVEYDGEFYSGNYPGIGRYAFIGLIDVNAMGSVETAFEHTTGMNATHIIHYSEDELYDAEGNFINS